MTLAKGRILLDYALALVALGVVIAVTMLVHG